MVACWQELVSGRQFCHHLRVNLHHLTHKMCFEMYFYFKGRYNAGPIKDSYPAIIFLTSWVYNLHSLYIQEWRFLEKDNITKISAFCFVSIFQEEAFFKSPGFWLEISCLIMMTTIVAKKANTTKTTRTKPIYCCGFFWRGGVFILFLFCLY